VSRDFNKNTANYINLPVNAIGSLLDGAGAMSWHCWFLADSLSTGNIGFNVLFAALINDTGPASGIIANIGHDGANHVLRTGGRSQQADSFQSKTTTATFSISTWYAVGGVLDFAGDTVTPYVNGAADGGGAVTFGASAYTNSVTTLIDPVGYGSSATGTPSSTSSMFDGAMGELAIWNAALTAADMASLADGMSPLLVRPSGLVIYLPFVRGDQEWISGKTATTNGTVGVRGHPRTIKPKYREVFKGPAAVTRYSQRQILIGVGA
jgi:hypothetical protein